VAWRGLTLYELYVVARAGKGDGSSTTGYSTAENKNFVFQRTPILFGRFNPKIGAYVLSIADS